MNNLNDWKEQIKSTSTKIDDGGDSHGHKDRDGGVVVTTQVSGVPGGFSDHVRVDANGNVKSSSDYV